MSTPETNQASVPTNPAPNIETSVSNPGRVVYDSAAFVPAEPKDNDKWKVPEYLNRYWSASNEERVQIRNNIESELNAVGGFSTTFQDINVQSTGIAMPRTIMAGGAIASILRTIGQSIKDDIIMAQQYAKDDELIRSHLHCKDLFFSSGFSCGVQNEKKRAAFRTFAKNPLVNLKKVAQDAMTDWNTTDNIVLIWNVTDGEVTWLTAMDPSRCVYKNLDGRDQLSIVLDVEAMREITSYINTGGPASGGVAQGEVPRYPDRWKEAASKGGALVLDRKEGDGFAIVTRAHKYNGFCRPGMRTIFFDAMIRDLLKAGEWACAVFLQSCIQHIKIGPKDGDLTTGIRQGMKDYPYGKVFNSLNLTFLTPSRARRLITDSTVSLQHVTPDTDIFSLKKFESCNARIDEWGGVPAQIRTGKGDGYSQGFLGFKRFEADGLESRDAVEQAFEICFDDPLVRRCKALKLSDSDVVSYTWNKQILKDPKQVLEELKFCQNNGLIDPRTIHEHLGLDHETILSNMQAARKELDADGETIWRPLFEPRQGLLTEGSPTQGDGGEGGRPQEGGPSGRRPRAAVSAAMAGSNGNGNGNGHSGGHN